VRRIATVLLIVGPVLLVALLPLRPLVLAVWPAPVDEVVQPDGRWILVPWLRAPWLVDDFGMAREVVGVRTRPLSLVEVQFHDGVRVHGYLVDRTGSSDIGSSLLLETGPDDRRLLRVTDLAFVFYPNDMSLTDRVWLAWERLKQRQPIS
jgi:hypothetical protein